MAAAMVTWVEKDTFLSTEERATAEKLETRLLSEVRERERILNLVFSISLKYVEAVDLRYTLKKILEDDYLAAPDREQLDMLVGRLSQVLVSKDDNAPRVAYPRR